MSLDRRDAPHGDFIVHNYSRNSTQASSQSLLDIAYRLIDAASSRSPTWVHDHLDYPAPSADASRRMVQYTPFSQRISLGESEAQAPKIADWGAQTYDQGDIFSLADLDDFITTDLAFVFEARSTSSPAAVIGHFQTLFFDEGSLHAVIPLPHIHPSSFKQLNKALKLVPYQKAEPIFLSPHTGPFSPPPYARYAWLIPVRGKFSYEQCTGAVVLDPSCDYNTVLDSNDKIEEHIVWTHASLQSFWAFLLEIKATWAAGAIGLSFQVTRGASAMSQSVRTTSTTLPKNLPTQTLPYPSIDAASHPQSIHSAVPPRSVLSNVDHIKIYHEAPKAMHLRNMLHLWSLPFPSGSEQPLKKNRILKCARLALVDERSAGILLC